MTDIVYRGGAASSADPSRNPVARAATATDAAHALTGRRRQVARTRRRFLLVDLIVSALLVVAALLAGYVLAAAAVAVGYLLIAVRVWASDSPREMARLSQVVRSGALAGALLCVVDSVLALATSGSGAVVASAVWALTLVGFRLLVRSSPFADSWGVGRRRRMIVGDPQALDNTQARRSPAVASGDVLVVVTRAGGASRLDGRSDKRTRTDVDEAPAGLVERIVRTALENSVERVTVIPGPSWQQRQLRELSWLLEGTGVDMVVSTSLDRIAPHRAEVVQQDGRLVVKVGSATPRGIQVLLKGAIDRVCAAVLLLLISPVLLVIAAALRLESPGPAIFTQTRVRERGVTFTMFKFRTMRMDAEQLLDELASDNVHADQGPLFKIVHDPRVTRLGGVLRRTSLDELPQLMNVMLGQMSLIGPRPALPREVAAYDFMARRRLAVKPGMTGLWQVSGRSRLSWEESIGFDLDYVDNWSPSTDAAIAVRTLRAVVTKDGAF